MKKEIQTNFKDIQHSRRKRRLVFRISFLVILFAAFTFSLVRFIFHSGFFKFETISFVNAESLDQEKVLDFLKNEIENGSFFSRSLGVENFLAWPKAIAGKDLPTFPEIEKLEIDRKYSDNALVISAFVREPLGIWCLRKIADPKCFWFSDEGVIFKESLMPSGNLVKVVSDYSQSELVLGGKILDEYLLPNFLSIFEVASKVNISITEIKLEKLADEEIAVKTALGATIYFSLRHSARNYLPVLNSLVKKPGLKKLEYIDLRTENRVYYR